MPLRPGQDKKTCFIFQHGWGFANSAWHAWQNFIPEGSCQYLDRGYWGNPVIPSFAYDRGCTAGQVFEKFNHGQCGVSCNGNKKTDLLKLKVGFVN